MAARIKWYLSNIIADHKGIKQMSTATTKIATLLTFIGSLLPALAMDAPSPPAAASNLLMPTSHNSASSPSLYSLSQDKLLTSALQKCAKVFPDLYNQCPDSYLSCLKKALLERGLDNLEDIEDLFQAIHDHRLLSIDEAGQSKHLESDWSIIWLILEDPSFSTESLKLLGDLFRTYNLRPWERFQTVEALREAKLTSAQSIKETLELLAKVSKLRSLTIKYMWVPTVITVAAEDPDYKRKLLKIAKHWWLRVYANLYARNQA